MSAPKFKKALSTGSMLSNETEPTTAVPSTSRKTVRSSAESTKERNNNEAQNKVQSKWPHPHLSKQQQRFCIKNFYEDDEFCRVNRKGKLEFGIVSRYENDGTDDLKVFWTLHTDIEEQALELDNPQLYEHFRLVDRKAEPGDIIFVNQKRGQVIDVSWTSYVRIMENRACLLDIPCQRLEPLLPHYPGQRIELDGWIGTIMSISTEATLMFSKRGTVTGVVDCGDLPDDQQPYPGRRVNYTYEEYMEAGLTLMDDNTINDLFDGEYSLEAFVLFLHVSQIEVKWNGRVAPTNDSTEMPPTELNRSQFKKQVNILGSAMDMDWDSNAEAVERFYQCSVHPNDLILTDKSEDAVEEYMVKKFFDYGAEVQACSKNVVDILEKGFNIATNVPYTVKVLRFSRCLHVRWSSSGKIDKIPANLVTHKHAIKRPFHQFVQRKVTLAPFTNDQYAIINTFDTNDTVSVQWLTKPTGSQQSELDSSELFEITSRSVESIYDLEPHFLFGKILPKQIVYRSLHCNLPEAVFTVGWIRSLNQNGRVTVISMRTNQENEVYPSEIGTTGMKIHDEDSSVSSPKRARSTVVDLHGLPRLKAADQLFIANLQRQLEWAGETIPETGHFEMLPIASTHHTFYKLRFEKKPVSRWMRAVKKDQIYLKTRANSDLKTIWVKGYVDRFDLYSVIMGAPAGTPYDGGLYEFDVQLGENYPSNPPSIYMTTVVAVDGCTSVDPRAIIQPGVLSLELLTNCNTTLPHTLGESLVSIQSKLFSSSGSLDSLSPPSSAGSFQRRESLAKESEEKLTNAQIIIDVLDLLFRLIMDPPKLWSVEVFNHVFKNFDEIKARLLSLICPPKHYSPSSGEDWFSPNFPLVRPTEGFAKAVVGRLRRFEGLMMQL